MHWQEAMVTIGARRNRDCPRRLAEGAVANAEQLRFVRLVRERSRVLISFGDCAVTGNVTALRNPLGGAAEVLRRSYLELPDVNPQVPSEAGIVPTLLDRVTSLHGVVAVDIYLPGCPPPAARIRKTLEDLIAGRPVQLAGQDIRFG
jgi:NAD-reducing hydrogenase small subunit